MTQLHLVGGFLGSGKTTAIIQACKVLMAQRKRVGVITNDQGKYLVDTAFFRFGAVPTLEVTGGCFCCNYADLDQRIEQLVTVAQPDVLFAESVGSCADLVTTVVKPLLSLGTTSARPCSFSVFVDVRLLRLLLAGQELPFSENINYIFEKQIEEAGFLVINKCDLLPLGEVAALFDLARQRYPEKEILTQSSLSPTGIADWLWRLAQGDFHVAALPLSLDYVRYGRGETELAWLDETIFLEGEKTRTVLVAWLGDVNVALQVRHAPIGHLKLLLVSPDDGEVKVSFTTPMTPGWEAQIPDLRTGVKVLLNARVQMDAGKLQALFDHELERAASRAGVLVRKENTAAFHPALPQPAYGAFAAG